MRTALLQEYYDSPEYLEKLRNRFTILKKCDEDPLEISRYALEDWSNNPISFIEQFGWVIIPEFNNEVKPFFLFDYQKKIITHIWESELSGEDHEILIDKPRGMGLTWLICWYQIWRWLFVPNWGGFNLSRTEDEVDRGDADPNSSIFGKYRWAISHLPYWLVPEGFVPKGKKGTSTDMQLRISNPTMGSTLVGSTTNREAGRSRRYAFSFIDESFSIEHFQSVYRSLQSVSRTKIFVSTVKAGRIYKDFKDMCEKNGDYISLSWKDHPFKDEIWYQEQLKKAEFDPEIMKEVEVNYAISSKSQYYPQIKDSKILYDIVYDKKCPLFVSLDFGQQDLTVIIWTFWDGMSFNVLECLSFKRQRLEWYIPFLNPEKHENEAEYLPHQLKLLNRVRSFGKAKAFFGEAAHFQKIMPNNYSIADVLIRNGIRLMYNPHGISHESRQKATSLLLPKTNFNFSSEGVCELYDAITNSRYSESNKGTSKESHMKPVHDTEIADFRSAFENGCVNFPRILRMDRENIHKDVKGNQNIINMIKFLKI